MYEHFWKRLFDIVLSLFGMVLLFGIYVVIAVAIVIDDPGPVIFTQKRIGIHKSTFRLHKFRTMRMNAPKDKPTHLLKKPEKYITRVGRFLRKSSLDELPQLWDILVGKMSMIGPRPALWNQEDLVAQRDLYGANDIKPGLTGWAQINGRDELEIAEKAKLDGEYVHKMSFRFDCICFFRTIRSVLKHEGFVEGKSAEFKTYQK